MIKTNSPLVCLLCFFVIFTVLGFLCHHCSSHHKTESRQHTWVLNVFNSEAVCIQKIQPMGIFFHPQLRLYDPCTRTNVSSSKILTHYAENEHFPLLILRSLISVAPCDIVIRHGCRKGLKLDLGPQPFPRPCLIMLSQGASERGDVGINSEKCSFSV